MTSEERNERIKKMFKDDLDLLLRKGHDYSGDSDCMCNLRDFGFLGVVVRLGDKYHRLKSFVEQGKMKVKDESVIDTLRDMRNYAFLAQILWEDSQEKPRKVAWEECWICGQPVYIDLEKYEIGFDKDPLDIKYAHKQCLGRRK